MKNAANVLSTFRLIGGTVASVFVLFGPELKNGVLVLLALASLTEPLDGKVAGWLRARRNLADPWFTSTGKALNELATMPLAILLPGAVLVRLIICTIAGLPMGYLSVTLEWAAVCAMFIVLTLILNQAKAQLVPERAEKAEVWQAWLTGVIVASCAYMIYAINSPASNEHLLSVGSDQLVWIVVVGLLVSLIAVLGDNRLTRRKAERPYYTGNKLWLWGKSVR